MEVAERTLRQTLATRLVEERAPFSYLQRRLQNALAMASADLIALSMSLVLASFLYLWWQGSTTIPLWGLYLLPAWYCGAVLLHMLPSWGLGPVEELRRLTILIVIVFGSTAAALALSRQTINGDQITLLIALPLSAFTVPMARIRVKRALLASDQWGVPTVIYGNRTASEQILRLLQHERGLGYIPVGVYSDDATLHGEFLEDVEVLGSANLIDQSAPVAVLAMPGVGRARSIELLEGPLAGYPTVIVIPDLIEAPSLWVKPRDLRGVLGLEITCNLCRPLARLVKRSFDVSLVLLTTPLWVPLCILLALLIWLEDRSHPLFFQQRVGANGRLFKTWKFRTMAPNAEEILQRALELIPDLREEWNTYYKLKKDPRVTRVGRLLRRLSLDEIPQLVNVLRGEMSLVGPRPLPVYHHSELPARVQTLRERVKPGLTGLWQVSGRSDAGNQGMEMWDPYYVRNWSLWLDAVILIRTARAVVSGSGAY